MVNKHKLNAHRFGDSPDTAFHSPETVEDLTVERAQLQARQKHFLCISIPARIRQETTYNHKDGSGEVDSASLVVTAGSSIGVFG